MANLYRHYKGKLYNYLGVVRHSETLEELVLYKTRYENDLGKVWVRPRQMFFEKTIVSGEEMPRFEEIQFEFRNESEMSSEVEKNIFELCKIVFGKFDENKFKLKIFNKKKILVQTVWWNQNLAGFKIGYALDATTYYSWLGAISPDYRNCGLAQDLMTQQHAWCKKNGFQKIHTKSQNKWKEMLALNIKNGFEIVGVEKFKKKELKIILEKSIQ